MTLKLGVYDFFFILWLDQGYRFLEEYTDVNPPLITSYQREHDIHGISLGMLISISWLRQCLPDFSTMIAIFSFSIIYSLEVSKSSPHSRKKSRAVLCLVEQRISIYIICNSLYEFLSLFLHLHIYSIFYQYRIRDIYYIIWVIINTTSFILLLKLFQQWPWL